MLNDKITRASENSRYRAYLSANQPRKIPKHPVGKMHSSAALATLVLAIGAALPAFAQLPLVDDNNSEPSVVLTKHVTVPVVGSPGTELEFAL